MSPAVEIDATDRVMNPDCYTGIDGVRRLIAELTYWSVWTVREGKVVKLSLHVERDQAVAAAGLPA